MDQVEDAVKDFEKSVLLSPLFAVAHVQKCYTGWTSRCVLLCDLSSYCTVKEALDRLQSYCNVFLVFFLGQKCCAATKFVLDTASFSEFFAKPSG